MNNEKAKNAKQEGEKFRIREPHIVKLIWKIHEAARGKWSVVTTLRRATCQVSLEKSWTSLK